MTPLTNVQTAVLYIIRVKSVEKGIIIVIIVKTN